MTDTINPLSQYRDVINSCKIDNTFIFTAVLNRGYLMYTMNMLKSLQPWGLDKKILLICLDIDSYDFLLKRKYNAVCINTHIKDFLSFNSGTKYLTICFFKWFAISKLLDLGHNVLYTDGDIVFRKDPLPHVREFTEPVDIWIQNDAGVESEGAGNLCTGYFYVKSNETTRYLFCLETDEQKQRFFSDSGDQAYFNMYMKEHLQFKTLPLRMYPNGKCFFHFKNSLLPICILVHFNWVLGHEKMAKMREHEMWLLTEDEEDEFSNLKN